jgi:hypothetical protein
MNIILSIFLSFTLLPILSAQEKTAVKGRMLKLTPISFSGRYSGQLTQAENHFQFELDLKEKDGKITGTSTITTKEKDAFGIFNLTGVAGLDGMELEEKDLKKHDGPFAWYRKKMVIKMNGEHGLKGSWQEADSNADRGELELQKVKK